MADGINILIPIIAVVIALVIAVPVACKLAVAKKVKQDAEKIGTAEEKARNIIDEALKTAETKKREALLEAKEESLKTKNELEKETRERRSELQKYEKRVLAKEESVFIYLPLPQYVSAGARKQIQKIRNYSAILARINSMIESKKIVE